MKSDASSASSYHPECWGALCRLLAKQAAGGSPPPALVASFLAARTRGALALPDLPEWRAAAHDLKACYLAGSPARLAQWAGGAEGAGQLWAAMLLKKRVGVTGGSLPQRQQAVRSLPMLVWHRQAWDLMQPLVASTAPELAQLAAQGVWCAGFLDDARALDLWDVLLDLDAGKVIVADHARELLAAAAGPAREVGKLLAAGSEDEDQATLKTLVGRNRQLLDRIGKIGTPKVTLALIQEAGLAAPMDRFLYSVAQAEGMAE